ncbi:MAG: hypothetical protein IIA55_11390 [Gemmatimonadetes bacterium]|nr:hypothetical protein [Gemmatimonadota bacterium]
MQPLPIVRVLETLEPIPLDSSHEIRVEMISVDGACRIRAREWERAPADSVYPWVSAIREFIKSLVPDTAVHPVRDFVEEACAIVGARLVSGDLLDLAPSEIVERLEVSGILAQYKVRVTKPLPTTLEVQEWQPTDEVVEVTNPTMAGWLDVVRGTDESREAMRQTIETEND